LNNNDSWTPEEIARANERQREINEAVERKKALLELKKRKVSGAPLTATLGISSIDTQTRPFWFIVHMSLWGLVAGPVVVSLPWPFLFPMFFLFGGLPAMMAGTFLGLQYRSRPIPESFFSRALNGARAGTLSAGVCYAVTAIIGEQPAFPSFVFGVLGFAAIGAFAGAVAFAVMMPAELRCFGLQAISPDDSK
jgi:hypothetical protein